MLSVTHSDRSPFAHRAVLFICLVCSPIVRASQEEETARRILEDTAVKGGLIVHIGCGEGKLTAALYANDSYRVHGLDANTANVEQAREHIRSLGIYGPASVERWTGSYLPYIDNLVNLIVATDLDNIPMEELIRVLAPEGVAYIRKDNAWLQTIKPRPDSIDEWTHYLHDSSNNAVAHDTVVGPPRRLQWMGSPRWARHHDRMSSVSAVVSSGSRVFYIFDEASRVSILLPPEWTLIARDAFNGTILWKRPIENWHTHLWPLKSGPAQLPRRLVAIGNRVFATLSLDGPLVALDAATGKTARTYQGTKATEEIVFSEGVLFLLVNTDARPPAFADLAKIRHGQTDKFWDEAKRDLVAVRAETGEILWSVNQFVLPGTLAADKNRVVFNDGQRIVCLDRNTGQETWKSEPIARIEEIRSFYLPILVLHEDVILFSGGETAGGQKGEWYTSGKDTLSALSAEDGKQLWSAYHPPSGYRSPEDLLVVDGLVWTGETTSGRAAGVFTGRDLHTGEIKREFPPDVDTYWFHHRCYRGKATANYLLMSRAGTEFIDVRNEHWIPNHWVRGACLYGVMPANGLLYAPQHPCACYLESKMYGFNALAPAAAASRVPDDASGEARLVKGAAYGKTTGSKPSKEEWPTYRHDAARSGHASTSIAPSVKPAWRTKIGGKLTSPVAADGKIFVASIDTHTVHAIDAQSGREIWQYTAGGRVDSPPTIYQGLVLFGSADGWVYCLHAADGALAWRFRAAPLDQRLMAFEQLESVWPLHGSVLVKNDVIYCVAGRSMFIDGGLRLLRLDPKTGSVLSETVLDDKDHETGKRLDDYVSWLNMPTALPDILSSDGELIYMRSQPFRLDGTRLPLKPLPRGTDADRGAPPADQLREYSHLFCPSGFLDDSWWHRTYWMYGSTFVSGWCGYYKAGKRAPSGRILVFDDSRLYGFGRKPEYYRWTTPIEHHLFASDRMPPTVDTTTEDTLKGSLIRIPNTRSLNPTRKPLTVEAWVKAERPDGVVVARGGDVQGYSLYLKQGRPHFAIRSDTEQRLVSAKEPVVGRWVHLAGVLTDKKQLRIYVDGQVAATATSPFMISANPHQATQIGADEGSPTGDYNNPFPFTGLIDELRIYHRALSDAEIARHAASDFRADRDTSAVVLFYSFDQGNAADQSGHSNDGAITGAKPVQGKIGMAMKFAGEVKKEDDFMVEHDWTKDLPLFARAMVLADGVLFLAGPPDVIDEEQEFKKIDDPNTRAKLIEQAASLRGDKGSVLWAVSAADGDRLAEIKLDVLPVFDGLIAANRHLYLSATDGSLSCFAGGHMN